MTSCRHPEALRLESIGPLRAIEFFSGIGGWRRALQIMSTVSCNREVKVCQAYDVNPAANLVYHHNFCETVSSVSDFVLTDGNSSYYTTILYHSIDFWSLSLSRNQLLTSP